MKKTKIQRIYFFQHDKLPPLESLAENFIRYLEPIIKEKYVNKNPEERIMELREIVNLIKPYNSLDAFLADILTQYDLEGQTINAGNELDEEKPLVLSTIHQSKGLEWTVVFLMTLVEGQMPISKSIGDPDEIEEERRLFYVACTRAKDHLILTYPQFFPTYNYGRSDIIEGPSRFLTEIRDLGVYEEVEVEDEF